MSESADRRDLHPIATRVLYEDEEVRIWDQRVGPGEELRAHRHENDYILADVRGEKLEIEFLPGGDVDPSDRFELPVERGRALLIKRGAVERAWNVGASEYRAILIEYKQPVPGAL